MYQQTGVFLQLVKAFCDAIFYLLSIFPHALDSEREIFILKIQQL
jgi:hypothetical protein